MGQSTGLWGKVPPQDREPPARQPPDEDEGERLADQALGGRESKPASVAKRTISARLRTPSFS